VSDPQDPEELLASLSSGQVQFAPMRLNAVANILQSNEYGDLMLPIEGRDVNRMVSQTRELAAPRGLEVRRPSLANVSSAWVVSNEFARRTGVRTISDLATLSARQPVTLGGPPPCADRSWCKPFLENDYGVTVGLFEPLDWGGGLTRSAIASGDVDVAWLSGNDGGITEFGFTALVDDRGLQSVNPITPVLSIGSASDSVRQVADAVSTVFTTDDLKDMIYRVEFDRQDLTDVVAAYLRRVGLAS
jgi:osmoprotectant transport system substrate-binding protein